MKEKSANHEESIIYPERMCYVCGRTEKDLETLLGEKITILDSRIRTLENTIRKYGSEYRDYLSDILKDTEGGSYLDFGVETVETDLPKFREKIPRLDDILKYKKHSGFGRKSVNEPLSEIRKRIKIALESSDELNIYDFEDVHPPSHAHVNGLKHGEKPPTEKFFDHKKKVDGMREELDRMISGKKEASLLKEYNIHFKSIYGSVEPEFGFRTDEIEQKEIFEKLSGGGITVYMCLICNDMFSRASSAAFEVIHEDDTDKF